MLMTWYWVAVILAEQEYGRLRVEPNQLNFITAVWLHLIVA